MVGIYCSKNLIRFSRPDKKGQMVRQEYMLGGEEVEQVSATIESIFKTAQKELGFNAVEDFRLLVDFPLCYSIAQMVPFPESQLAQVLENYLEEELPNDIEDYAFDYQVLESKGASSSILAFWIKRSVLQEWSELANEWSLNSLDIQPAEMALIKSSLGDEPTVDFQLDPLKRVRYCSLLQKNQLPHLTIGMFKDSDSDENIKKTLQFSLTDLSDIKKCTIHPELSQIETIKSVINCEQNESFETTRFVDCFEEYAVDNPKIKQLNYRKGDFAQKGIEEKVLIPVIILFVAILSCIGAFAWKNHQLHSNEKIRQAALQKQMKNNFQMLAPGIPVPKSNSVKLRINELKRALGIQNNNSKSKKDDNKNFSALQTLGQLFLYIEQDPEVVITRASLNSKSINLTGTTTEQERAYKLKTLFKNQKIFETPDVRATKVRKVVAAENPGDAETEDIKYKFTFKTSLIKK